MQVSQEPTHHAWKTNRQITVGDTKPSEKEIQKVKEPLCSWFDSLCAFEGSLSLANDDGVAALRFGSLRR